MNNALPSFPKSTVFNTIHRLSSLLAQGEFNPACQELQASIVSVLERSNQLELGALWRSLQHPVEAQQACTAVAFATDNAVYTSSHGVTYLGSLLYVPVVLRNEAESSAPDASVTEIRDSQGFADYIVSRKLIDEVEHVHVLSGLWHPRQLARLRCRDLHHLTKGMLQAACERTSLRDLPPLLQHNEASGFESLDQIYAGSVRMIVLLAARRCYSPQVAGKMPIYPTIDSARWRVRFSSRLSWDLSQDDAFYVVSAHTPLPRPRALAHVGLHAMIDRLNIQAYQIMASFGPQARTKVFIEVIEGPGLIPNLCLRLEVIHPDGSSSRSCADYGDPYWLLYNGIDAALSVLKKRLDQLGFNEVLVHWRRMPTLFCATAPCCE